MISFNSMRLDKRKEHILDFIVRDYIEMAQPVSSGRVYSKRVLDSSPATLRNIMLELDEDGFLYQPHISAGRTPTEKGYRYFIENLMEIESPAVDVRRDLDGIMEDFFGREDNAFNELSRILARHLKLFSGFGLLDEERIFGHGLSDVLREPEFFEHESAVRFADFAENIHKNIGKFADTEPGANGFGLIQMTFKDSDLGECVIFSAGPQRMDYEKATSVLKYAAEDISRRRRVGTQTSQSNIINSASGKNRNKKTNDRRR